MKTLKSFGAGTFSLLLLGLRIFAADSANQPPGVRIVSPPDGAVFAEPSDIRILAAAKDADGWVRTVEFFADGNSLGVVTNPPTMFDVSLTADGTLNVAGVAEADAQLMGDAFLDMIPINPFHLDWQGVPPGHHVLTAVATDNLGASSESDPVAITVLDFKPPSVVTVTATDPTAAEGDSNTATFTFHRSGRTNTDLVVNYQLGGTASNGVDYIELPSTVTIPAGSRTADVLVVPIDDSLIEGTETVVLRLGPPPCPDATAPSDDCYLVGRCDRAVAIIRDNDQTNRPPVVRILNPQSGEIFRAGSNIRLSAAAWDFDGSVKTVEFFEGANSLGVVTNPSPFAVWEDDPAFRPIPWLPLYSLVWSNVPPSEYELTAVATDDQTASTVSTPVKIRVVEIHPPPVVTIKATDPDATEINPLSASLVLDNATFTVSRTGSTDSELTVYYRIGGTAENGIDYQELPHKVTIPPGASSADIVVSPIDDEMAEGDESVILSLTPPICITIFPPPPCCYVVGDPGSAKAVIHDNEPPPENQPPMVRLNNPQDGQIYVGPTDIHLVAYAQDREDGYDLKVEFFEGANSLGFGEFVPTRCASPYCPNFSLTWSNVPPGEYTLTAVATDKAGVSTRSDPAHIKVISLPRIPVVTIVARDPFATEQSPLVDAAPDTATFVVHRSGGDLSSPLAVHYRIGGTASNGVDYDKLSGEVIIPAQSESAEIVVNPIDDDLVEGTENVVLSLLPGYPPCLFAKPPCEIPMPEFPDYYVGFPGEAVAFIRDNDEPSSNTPPTVHILRPTNGQTFFAQLWCPPCVTNTPPCELPCLVVAPNIEICADARDSDGYVDTVEFFANDHSLGIRTNCVQCASPQNPFCLDWSLVPPGDYVLRAKATDNGGAVSWSEPVRIVVLNDQPPNLRPFVKIVQPQNGDTFPAPSDIEIDVKAQDPDGWVHLVEFFANGVKIGEQSIEFIVAPPPNQEQMFSLVWSNVTTGRYVLSAKATDDSGATSVSDPVEIAVGDVPPPVPVIGIVASDPFASENVSSNGTNTATFRIFRNGPTNADLTVFYSVHGTASNGVDYVEIGNTATIPAGRHSARIVIVPIDDDIAEGIETVVLKLEPDPSLGPIARYEVGHPDKAAAIIVDNDAHKPPCLRLPDGAFHLCLDRPDGFAFSVEASDDLTVWVPLCTNVVTDGALHFVDPDADQHRHRFYRIVPQSNYVPEE